MTAPKRLATEAEAPVPSSTASEPWLAFVAQKARSLDYGTIQIVIHDGKIVQVEATERRRFDVRRPS